MQSLHFAPTSRVLWRFEAIAHKNACDRTAKYSDCRTYKAAKMRLKQGPDLKNNPMNSKGAGGPGGPEARGGAGGQRGGRRETAGAGGAAPRIGQTGKILATKPAHFPAGSSAGATRRLIHTLLS
jgi:hypothetical protein